MNARLVRWLGSAALVMGLALMPGAARGATKGVDANDVLTRMRSALTPGKDMRATVVFAIANDKGDIVRWTGQLYRRGGPSPRTRIVFEDPPDLRGTVVSVFRADDGTTKTRLYLPTLRRTRLIEADTRGESFLGTDFNYEDLGLQQLDPRQVDIKEAADKGCYHLESVPKSGWWYGKVDRCVDRASYLPLRTEYYDRSGILWKVRTLENVTKVDGYPTPTEIQMQTLPQHTSTTITFSDVHYDTGLPDSVFATP
ncbi:MAG TPA: outer membrane lipoprotein-sorting protein [Candidatus Binatia bacterium]|jgi:outer membrane lipoprotein-sorting protein